MTMQSIKVLGTALFMAFAAGPALPAQPVPAVLTPPPICPGEQEDALDFIAPSASNTFPVCPGMMALPSGLRPMQIFVHSFRSPSGSFPAFSLSAKGPFYREGFTWQSNSRPLFVTLVYTEYLAGIRSEYTALQISETYNGKQFLVIPPYGATYEFDVIFANGTVYDPKIIVTPISEQSQPNH